MSRKKAIRITDEALYNALRELCDIAASQCGHSVTMQTVADGAGMKKSIIYNILYRKLHYSDEILTKIIAEYTKQIEAFAAGKAAGLTVIADQLRAVANGIDLQLKQVENG